MPPPPDSSAPPAMETTKAKTKGKAKAGEAKPAKGAKTKKGEQLSLV
jgi:hypothetical protein